MASVSWAQNLVLGHTAFLRVPGLLRDKSGQNPVGLFLETWLLALCERKSESESEVAQLCPTLCDPMDCSLPGCSVHGIFQAKSTGVGCHFLLQGIFPTEGSNPSLPHCRQTLYYLSHQGSSCERKGVFFILGLGKLIGRSASRILGLDRITKGSMALGHLPIPHLRLYLNYPR